MTGARLSAGDDERLRSWSLDVVAAILPEGTPHRDEGNDRRFLGKAGLLVDRRDGRWYWHAKGCGGYSLVSLISLLKECSHAEAIIWAAGWLSAHPGTGSCDGGVDEEAATQASAAIARDVLARVADVVGTPGEIYLRSRNLDLPFPDCVKYLHDARIGEGAVVGLLTSHDRIVGIEINFVDAVGRRTVVEPRRRRIMLEKTTDAVFSIPSPGENDQVVVCEGLSDTLSVYRYGKQRCRVVGIPGVGTLRHLKFSKGTQVLVVCDGDPPDSPAARGLQDGLDRALLDGASVLVTQTPEGWDANRVLMEHGVDGLLLLDSAIPAILSSRGEIEKLSQLDELDYALIRKAEAKRLGVPVGVLDSEVRKRREAAAAAGQAAPPEEEPAWFDIDDIQPWATEVDGAELLDTLSGTIASFVVMLKNRVGARRFGLFSRTALTSR